MAVPIKSRVTNSRDLLVISVPDHHDLIGRKCEILGDCVGHVTCRCSGACLLVRSTFPMRRDTVLYIRPKYSGSSPHFIIISNAALQIV